MHTPPRTVSDIGRDLADGQTIRTICPRCGGGDGRELSFAVTRAGDALLFNCHRASCAAAGVRGGARVHAAGVIPAVFAPRPYPWPLAVPGAGHFSWRLLRASGGPELAARIGLQHKADFSDELVWELRDFDWKHKGHVSRSYVGKTIRTWRTAPGPWYGYFADKRTPERLWIVEDPMSAARLQIGGESALCLFGTHLGTELRGEVVAFMQRQARVHGHPPLLVVALDPDATVAGMDMARRLTTMTGYDTMARPLNKDIKDMDETELRELLELPPA